MKIECPKCHNLLECEAGWCGQKAQCPYCKNKFVITEIMLKPVAFWGKAKWLCAIGVAAAVLCVAAGLGLGHVLFAPVSESGSLRSTAAETAAVKAGSQKSAATGVVAEDTSVSTATAAVAAEGAAASAATDENKADASQAADGQSAEEETLSAEDGDYTYEYYGDDIVPYYRGYYYVGGSWVWRGHGRAPFPPPRFRPVLRTGTAPVTAATPAPATAATPAPATASPSKPTPVKAVGSGQTTKKSVKPAPAKTASSPKKPTMTDEVIPDQPETPTPVKPVRVKRTPAKSVRRGGGRASAPRGPRR